MTKSEAWNHGHTANANHKLMNRYTYGTTEYFEWEEGWEHGRQERLKKTREEQYPKDYGSGNYF